jgi:tripartite-type tricarboxylate transporter receptor subunit TctC
MAGDVQVFFDAPTLLLPMAQAGKIKVLAVTSPTRMRELPQVPTAAESGVKEIEFSTWSAYMAPAGTPPEVVGKLRTTLAKVMAAPEMREALVARSFEPYAIAPEAIPASVHAETVRWAEIIKGANIKID